MSVEPNPASIRRVLLLAQSPQAAAPLRGVLASNTDIQIETDVERAVAAMRSGAADLLVTPPTELLPLIRRLSREYRTVVLEGIGQGVCILSRGGRLVWANGALRSYGPEALEEIRSACMPLVAELVAEPTNTAGPHVRRASLNVRDGQLYFDASISALPAGDGPVEEVLALLSDTTSASRARDRLEAIDAAGREIVALDVGDTAKLDVSERLDLLEKKLIGVFQDLLHFTHFAVLVIDPRTKHLDNVLSGGFSERAKQVDMYAREQGNGISGYVAATGRSYVCPDISRDPLYLPGLEHAASSLTVPLRLVDRIVGVLNVESNQPAAFSDEDRLIAEIFGRYIAVALHMLKLLAAERSETTGQVAADVAAEVSVPLDAIAAEASRLLEEMGGSEQTRRRVSDILARVNEAKERLQTAAKAPAVRGLMSTASPPDPLLQGRRVLVADDEEIIRETISDVLSKAGAIAVTARDGEEAIAMVRAQPFDLVLSDIKMPHKNGYEVFAAARETAPRCPVILITGFGYDPDHSIVRASREGLAAVLFKPFKVDQLMEAMHKAIASETP